MHTQRGEPFLPAIRPVSTPSIDCLPWGRPSSTYGGREERDNMNKVRAMSVRPCALPWLIGVLALVLATGGRASADTCLPLNSVDGAGTVTLTGDDAQGPVIPVQHPVLSGTVQNVDVRNLVSVGLVLFDSNFNIVAEALLEFPQFDWDTFPSAVEIRPWWQGTTTNFTIDANAMLAQHFPGIDLSQVASVVVELRAFLGTAVFSNLCLTDAAAHYAVAPLNDPNKAVKRGGVIPLK